jgi:hypothetical protein
VSSGAALHIDAAGQAAVVAEDQSSRRSDYLMSPSGARESVGTWNDHLEITDDQCR